MIISSQQLCLICILSVPCILAFFFNLELIKGVVICISMHMIKKKLYNANLLYLEMRLLELLVATPATFSSGSKDIKLTSHRLYVTVEEINCKCQALTLMAVPVNDRTTVH